MEGGRNREKDEGKRKSKSKEKEKGKNKSTSKEKEKGDGEEKSDSSRQVSFFNNVVANDTGEWLPGTLLGPCASSPGVLCSIWCCSFQYCAHLSSLSLLLLCLGLLYRVGPSSLYRERGGNECMLLQSPAPQYAFASHLAITPFPCPPLPTHCWLHADQSASSRSSTTKGVKKGSKGAKFNASEGGAQKKKKGAKSVKVADKKGKKGKKKKKAEKSVKVLVVAEPGEQATDLDW